MSYFNSVQQLQRLQPAYLQNNGVSELKMWENVGLWEVCHISVALLKKRKKTKLQLALENWACGLF